MCEVLSSKDTYSLYSQLKISTFGLLRLPKRLVLTVTVSVNSISMNHYTHSAARLFGSGCGGRREGQESPMQVRAGFDSCLFWSQWCTWENEYCMNWSNPLGNKTKDLLTGVYL